MKELARLILFAVGFFTLLAGPPVVYEVVNTFLYNVGYYS